MWQETGPERARSLPKVTELEEGLGEKLGLALSARGSEQTSALFRAVLWAQGPSDRCGAICGAVW